MPVTRASYALLFSVLFYRFILSFLGIWGFYFPTLPPLFVSQDAESFVTDTDPAMSSEARGGLPRAQASHQGSQAGGGLR
jgi:hypothetical protein